MPRFRFNYLKFFIPLGVLLGLTIYYNTSSYIRNHEWKHSQYDSLGDWIEFTNPFYYDLQWRTIYKQHKPAGIVLICFQKHAASNTTSGIMVTPPLYHSEY